MLGGNYGRVGITTIIISLIQSVYMFYPLEVRTSDIVN